VVREMLGKEGTSPFWVRSDRRNYRAGRRLGVAARAKAIACILIGNWEHKWKFRVIT